MMETPPRLRNGFIAITAMVLTVLLFLGVQAKGVDRSLSAVASHATPWEIAQQNPQPTLLEFYADWCTTCQEMAPDTRSLQEEFAGKLNFVMLDVDNSRWLPEMNQFQIEGIPHFIFLGSDNEPQGEAIGFVPKPMMVENLTALVAGEPLPHLQLSSARQSPFNSPLPADSTQPKSHS